MLPQKLFFVFLPMSRNFGYQMKNEYKKKLFLSACHQVKAGYIIICSHTDGDIRWVLYVMTTTLV